MIFLFFHYIGDLLVPAVHLSGVFLRNPAVSTPSRARAGSGGPAFRWKASGPRSWPRSGPPRASTSSASLVDEL